MDKTGISVIICTYNGEQQLPVTLRHLFNQQQLGKIDWEIIIVDNNSTDGTAAVVHSIINEHKNPQLKTFSQPIPGKLAALKLGIEQAQYKYLLICDDDNWLKEDYLIKAYQFMESNPEVGVLGGKGAPAHHESLPLWIIPHLHNYAAAEQWPVSSDVTHSIGSLYGAGMVLKKEIYDFVFRVNWPLYLSAIRKGKMLLSGEDTEICYIARLLGHKIYYHSGLEFKHNFPPSKLNQRYLLNLIYFFGYGAALLLPYTELETKKNNSIVKLIFLEVYRLLRYDLFNWIRHPNLECKKKIYYRYGFIKSLWLNIDQVKSLRHYLKYKLNNAGTASHI
jgi:glycosyltransferase involved in cell wall biosynthesis